MPWKYLARLGYAAKGALYLLVGLRALRAAFEPVPPRGSEQTMQSWGEALGEPFLVALGLGLLCFALWRAAQTVWSPGEEAGFWRRAGYALSGLIYFKLGKACLELVWERPDPDDAREAEMVAAFLFDSALGHLVVGAAGVIALIGGLYQLVKACRSELEGFSCAMMWLVRAGLAARALVFMMGGAYVLSAVWTLRPEQVASLSEILTVLKRDGGLPVLGLMGAGLVAYGLSMGMQARCYRPGQAAA